MVTNARFVVDKFDCIPALVKSFCSRKYQQLLLIWKLAWNDNVHSADGMIRWLTCKHAAWPKKAV